jgi:2,4-dienoyl-CoA reductase-like NADH-dependent reductase (Old Yellow Enzyme family)
MSQLFSPLTLRSVTLPNRVAASPMCMYMAKDGVSNDFHLSHLSALARGGAGLIFTEATAIEPRGRISHGCCGLWSEEQVEAYRPVTQAITAAGAVPAIQIAHGGRKASAHAAFDGGQALQPADAERGLPPWPTIAPSALAMTEGAPVPQTLSESKIAGTVELFAEAARRAARAGFRVLEVHAAHGYLIHSFLSPLSNKRNDAYGGELNGRMRYALEVAEAVRAAWPEDLPLFFRISSVDGPADGWKIEDSAALARELKARGVDVIDCSSGGIAGAARYRATDNGKPLRSAGERPRGFQVPYAEHIRKNADIRTMAVGVIVEPQQAEEIISSQRADLVALGRELLYNPFWPLHAAQSLDIDPQFRLWPNSYRWAVNRRAEILGSQLTQDQRRQS